MLNLLTSTTYGKSKPGFRLWHKQKRKHKNLRQVKTNINMLMLMLAPYAYIGPVYTSGTRALLSLFMLIYFNPHDPSENHGLE